MSVVVWNPTQETVSTKMQGAWFTFKPEAKRVMDADKGRFITENRKETGLVVLPPQFNAQADEYIEGFDKSEEGLAILEKMRHQGIDNLVNHHRDIIKNNQVSLRKDMARANPNGDANRLIALEMSPGELASLQIVSKYQKAKQDFNDQKITEINKLLEQVGPVQD